MYLVIGSGKTGSEVVKLIPKDQLLDVCNTKNPPTLALMQKATCIIVFIPAEAFESIKPMLIESGTPVVIGTTGIILDKLNVQAPWIHANNFSIGVNMLFAFARNAPKALIKEVKIYEEHHASKKDKPSGSSLYLQSLFPTFNIHIEAKREGDIQAAMQLMLHMDGEEVTVKHQALNRSIYAKGALFAAAHISRFSAGVYKFEEVINDL